MDCVIFNPLKNKKPSGASKNNERNIFKLLIKENINHENLKIVIFKDGQEENRMCFPFKFLNKEENYLSYSVEIDELETGLYFYYFEFCENGYLKYISNYDFEAKISNNISAWQLTIYDNEFKSPDWLKGGIMYQIFPDRFERNKDYFYKSPKNLEERIIHNNWSDIPNSSLDTINYSAKDFFMGNLMGIIDKKNYIKDLNINMIYLNPIFESSENHRYSTANYFNVDTFLGDNKIFRNLCKKFKEIGINIILDGVFSHTGADSIYFNKYNRYESLGAFNSKESEYYSWFNFRDYPNIYDSWWGFDNLPNLNKENKNYIDFICKKDTGVLNYWQDHGIKGWRIDVLDEFPDIFIDELRKVVKTKDEDCFILGEVWEDSTTKYGYGKRRKYLQGKQVDSVMNYPWRTAIIDFIKNKDAKLFSVRLQTIINNYPHPALDTLMNLLSSHDVERIITVLGTDIENIKYEDSKNFKLNDTEYKKARELQKIAVFIQFTLPGIPSIYYGDEIGMQGFKDPFNRRTFDLEKADINLLEYYKKLSLFRTKYKESFKSGFMLKIASKNTIAYYRNDILCIINLSDKPIILDCIKNGEDIFSEKKVIFTDYGLVVAPMSFAAILPSLNENDEINNYK